jgi:hypothetical protein
MNIQSLLSDCKGGCMETGQLEKCFGLKYEVTGQREVQSEEFHNL